LVVIMAGIAAFIKLVSEGPLFFVQDRIGYRGRRFKCMKFRTMKPHASCKSHQDYMQQLMSADVPMTKLDATGDPRLIPMGAFLRATGLDELPQVFNVWRGDMSLVGPRPCTSSEYDHYRPEQKERFNALPGLTGLWQVSGKNDTTFSQMIALDIAYVRTQSIGLDLRIMARTIGVLVKQVRRVSKLAKPKAPDLRVAAAERPLPNVLGQPDGVLGPWLPQPSPSDLRCLRRFPCWSDGPPWRSSLSRPGRVREVPPGYQRAVYHA
jgi:exopolysaccharide production protein ExoY